MDWLSTFWLGLVGAVTFLSVVFLMGSSSKRFDIIDVAWGPTFGVIALISMLNHAATWWKLLVIAMILIWGARLALHVGRRFIESREEDPRYVTMRRTWPQRAIRLQIFLRIYLAQALLASIVSLPVVLVLSSTTHLLGLTLVGLAMWLAGFLLETLADRQLRDFIAVPAHKGQLMTDGLWHYSRHPNYFGEITQWWGIGIIALGTSFGALGLIGPLMITLLILFVSGVPPAERRTASKPGWNTYKQRTSMIIPWPPKA